MTESTTCTPELYRENLNFWDRAWNMVKTPYTQMPDLDYINRIPKSLESKKALPVLDLGCGSGWLSIFLARAGFQVVGVDVANHALELAKSWAEDEGHKIDFQESDITSLGFGNDYFGSVVANSIFEHLTYELAVKTIQDIHKILQPGGYLLACFDLVGTGPGEYFRLADGTQVYTDKGRQGMILRCFSDDEIKSLLGSWEILELSTVASGTRFVLAAKKA